MARRPDAAAAPPQHQQMDRSNDPVETAALDAAAPATALHSRRQRLTGSAAGVGSVGFNETGAFDVGVDRHEPQDDPVATPPGRPARPEGA